MPNHITVFLKPNFWPENDSYGSSEVVYEPGELAERWETLGIVRVEDDRMSHTIRRSFTLFIAKSRGITRFLTESQSEPI